MAQGRTSAGILLFRRRARALEALLVHPGGPFWSRKDAGAWTIPKGELGSGEAPLAAALREFREETGLLPRGEPIDLGEVRQAGGKRVLAFALEGEFDPASLVSNTFEMEWPPRSGRRQAFPEVDRAAWFALAEARMRINPAQVAFVEALERHLDPRL